MKLLKIFEDLEEEIIARNLYLRCNVYERDCVDCKFWKSFDSLRKGLIELEEKSK